MMEVEKCFKPSGCLKFFKRIFRPLFKFYPLRLRAVRKGQKVIGIGLPKTGATTLSGCFKKMGYKHLSL